MIKENSEKCTYEKMWNKRPKYLRYLRHFGEIAVVKTGAKIKSKLIDRGHYCIFLGYPGDTSGNTHKFFNLHTGRVILSQDITWLDKSYGNWKGIKRINITQIDEDDSDGITLPDTIRSMDQSVNENTAAQISATENKTSNNDSDDSQMNSSPTPHNADATNRNVPQNENPHPRHSPLR